MLERPHLIPKYIARAILPYVSLTLILLTGILFAQQAGRFAEIAVYSQIPFSLLLEISLALLPGVLIFSIPAAALAGILVGFSRMGSDSEIVAMRAAGVGSWTLLWPGLLLGVLLTAATSYLHIKEAPEAARDLKRAALQGALRKLDSPVEPRTFTTEVPGYVIYVRDGDKSQGSWGRVFIYRQEPDGSVRVVTARSGRIDSSGNKSELVLSDAVATKIPGSTATEEDQKSYVLERLDQLRLAINTGRAELIDRLNRGERSSEELEWGKLREQASSGSDDERREGQRTIHRKLALSVSPLIFALLGGVLGLRVRRGGRAIGVVLSLVIVTSYYLVSLLGESLARVGTLSPMVGGWLATALVLCISALILAVNHLPWSHQFRKRAAIPEQFRSSQFRTARTVGSARSGFPSLLDVGLFRTLSGSFFLTFAALVLIVIIFTLFELWRFIGVNHVPLKLVGKYLLFLLPLVTVELVPATMLVTVLITYALLARRSEAIAWWACGQSVYRLMLPGLLFAVLAAIATWLVQEQLMPSSNVKQDSMRSQIRGTEARAMTGTGRQWLASIDANRLYSYEFDEQQLVLHDPLIFEFDRSGTHLLNVIKGTVGSWTAANELTLREAETVSLRQMEVSRTDLEELKLKGVESQQVFKPSVDKPSQLSANALSAYLKGAKRRGMDVSALAVALQRKYAGPFSVLVMAFIGMPLALSFGRRGAIIALCVAVGVGLAFWGVSGGFRQLGNHGLLPPEVAGWSPLIIFAAAGSYLLSQVRT